jgi:Nif11 domain
MSSVSGVQDALRFLAAARSNVALRRELETFEPDVTIGDLAAVGQAHGLRFTADELLRAHAIDWRIRQARYLRVQMP